MNNIHQSTINHDPSSSDHSDFAASGEYRGRKETAGAESSTLDLAAAGMFDFNNLSSLQSSNTT
jgi:hypothetical protein